MNTRLALSLLCVLTACQNHQASIGPGGLTDPAGRSAPDWSIFPFDTRVSDMANGLRLVTVKTDYPDLIALHILVKTGSRNEVEKGKSGFAHFFEHMMFRGSKNYSAEEQARVFKEAGADRNAYTTDDYTNYHTTFAKGDLDQVLAIEADRFRFLEYSKGVFRTESQAVFGEYNTNSSYPPNKIQEVLRDTAFDVHPYKHTTLGFLADIVKMPRQYEYSRTFFDRWYKPEYTTIVVVGDIDHEAARELTQKHFAVWQRGTHIEKIPTEPPQKGPRTCHVNFRSETPPWVTVAFRGPAFSPDDKDMPTLDVLASIAFSSNSELYKRLFLEERKVDVLYTDFLDHRDPYLVSITARCKDQADIAYVRDQILSTCESLKKNAVSAERLAVVKANLKYSFTSGLDSSDGVANTMAGYVARAGSPDAMDKVYKIYDAVTAEDVRAIAEKYLVADSRTICTLLHGAAPELAEIATTEVSLEPAPVAAKSQPPAVAKTIKLDPEAADPQTAVLIKNGSPLVTMRVVFSSGAANDPPGKAGLAYVTSQMITNAATQKRGYDDLVALYFPMAAGVGGSVDKQMTVFSGTVHLDNLAQYYSLFCEQLMFPGFEQADLDRIKSNTASGIDAGLRRADDEETGKEMLYEQIYAGHPFGHLTQGSLSSVASITLQDVKDFYRTHYRGAFLGLAGNYPTGFPAKAQSDMVAAFGEVRDVAKDQIDYREGVPGIERNRLTIVDKNTRATGIHLGIPISITRAHEDWPALWLVRSYFGEHRSDNSYLFQRLREIRGLNYGDYAYIEYFPNGGGQMAPSPNHARTSQIFQIWIRPVPPENGPFTFKAMQFELTKLVKEGMPKVGFEATRTFLSKYVNVQVASQDRQLGYAIDSRFYGIGPFTKHVRDALAKVTLEDVNRVIRKYLRADRVHYVVITPDAAGFKKRLLGDAPTPITYLSKPSKAVLAEDKLIEALKIDVAPAEVRVVPIGEVFK